MSNEIQSTISQFRSAVNMTSSELSSWLKTAESKSVGQKKHGDDESTGHKSGRHIVELLSKDDNELTDDDIAHMKKVISYVHRHCAQRPNGDIEQTPWRYSLMNWGHDPLK